MKQETSELDDRTPGASMAPINDGEALIEDVDSEVMDDQGTEPFEAVELLKQVRDTAFDSSDEKLGLALGRSSKEISDWISGTEIMDSDALIKLRALAEERGAEIE